MQQKITLKKTNKRCFRRKKEEEDVEEPHPCRGSERRKPEAHTGNRRGKEKDKSEENIIKKVKRAKLINHLKTKGKVFI